MNELYDEQGVLMCQLEAFIDLRSMLPGVQHLTKMSQLQQHVARAQHSTPSASLACMCRWLDTYWLLTWPDESWAVHALMDIIDMLVDAMSWRHIMPHAGVI